MLKSLVTKIKKIPKKPGVYMFKDASGRLLYIGKAIDLKKRVHSHFFRNSSSGIPFIDKAADIDWIKTKNEKEAMLLEDQLIKKYKPHYNIQWKDDKSYFWVTFTQDEWPRVIISHALKVIADSLVNGQKSSGKKPKTETADQTGCQSQQPLGPFTNGRELKQVLRVLRKIIPYRTCKNPYEKPCLQWHIGLCPAHNPNSKLKTQNSKLQVKIKNYLNSLNALGQFLRLYSGEPIRIEAYDISNIQGKYATGSMIVFYGNKPSKSDYRKFRIKTVRGANDVAMIREVLKRRLAHQEWLYPDLILIDGGIAQLKAVSSIIHNSKFVIPAIALAKREEEIYTEYNGQKTLQISRFPESLRLTFQHIRDEAHRFAIFYYRYLHGQVVKIRKVRPRRAKSKKIL